MKPGTLQLHLVAQDKGPENGSVSGRRAGQQRNPQRQQAVAQGLVDQGRIATFEELPEYDATHSVEGSGRQQLSQILVEPNRSFAGFGTSILRRPFGCINCS